MLAMNGRIAGISGILGGLVQPGDRAWRAAFAAGLLGGGLVAFAWMPAQFGASALPTVGLVIAGLLVGIGTRLGGGCTSGHGVCGMSRLSTRSIVATGVFMMFAGITVFVTRHLTGIAA